MSRNVLAFNHSRKSNLNVSKNSNNVYVDHDASIEEDEQLAKALQEGLIVDLPQRNDFGNVFPPLPYFYGSGYRYMKKKKLFHDS